ncbi:MAG: PAS domain S-box protein [Candidatus Rokubacteria bacterium]|nr:PAS domain S-box protein [Candidatus Rokubacteria bacterium]
MPAEEPQSLRTSLRDLCWARLITAAMVLAAGAVLRYAGSFQFAFLFFALAVSVAGLVSCLLLIGSAHATDLRRFAWMQVCLDVALVTGIIAVTGGSRSVFTFLYVLTVLEGASLLARRGGLVAAGLAGLLYVDVVLGRYLLTLLGLAEPAPPTALEVLTVLLNAAVLFAIALLAGSLAERYYLAQRSLESQRKDFSDLQAFRDLIFQSVGSGLIAVNPEGRVTAFNRAAESITGVAGREALGQTWEALFGREVDLEEARQAVAVPGAQSRRYEIRLRRRDGHEVPVGISFWSLRSGGGEVVGLIGICQDLSSIKRMEQRVLQADRLATIGRLSANIAHEIRNPLASLSGAIEALVRELPADPGRERLVEIVLRESERLNRIIRDFLEYAGPAPMAIHAVDLADLLEEVVLLVEHRSLPAELKVIREYGEKLPARVDPQQLHQAIWNLCINAVQAMPEGGELRVGGRIVPGAEPARVQLWISDTGQGIAESDMPQIFEPFFSTKADGSGIGLALVYRVVQDHGGQIEVRSQPGAGTSFMLILPSADAAV